MLGYATNREDLSKGDELNGSLSTGDIAQFNEEGLFFITGRMKRFIKIQGNRISLDDIEKKLVDSKIDCLVHGEDDLLKIGLLSEDDKERTKAFLKSNFNFHHSVYQIFKLNKKAYNDSGKLLYAESFENEGNRI